MNIFILIKSLSRMFNTHVHGVAVEQCDAADDVVAVGDAAAVAGDGDAVDGLPLALVGPWLW